jgi:molybdenum cofactor cytidylyltransferase
MREIAAIILAAGLSTRMGQPKMILQWKRTTILGKVVSTLNSTGIPEIIVVTGAFREIVEQNIGQLSINYPVRAVYNADYASGEMLSSIQTGLNAIKPPTKAVLIALGDQPQLQQATIQSILSAYSQSGASLIIPSYRMHRGHPWLVSQGLWPKLIELKHPNTSRDFLNQFTSEIHYVQVNNDSILQDIDTPNEYNTQKPP